MTRLELKIEISKIEPPCNLREGEIVVIKTKKGEYKLAIKKLEQRRTLDWIDIWYEAGNQTNEIQDISEFYRFYDPTL
jgi:hypothetical protein